MKKKNVTRDVIINMLKEGLSKDSAQDSKQQKKWRFIINEQAKTQYDEASFGNNEGNLFILYSQNVINYLTESLEYDEELSEDFLRFCNDCNNLSQKVAVNEWIKSNSFILGEYYDTGDIGSRFGSNLCGRLLFRSFRTDINFDYEDRVILSVLNLNSETKNFSKPKAFKLKEEKSIFRFGDGVIKCNKCDFWWGTEDKTHWLPEGIYGFGRFHLQDYKAVSYGTGLEGSVVVTYDNQAYCPICGKGKLKAAKTFTKTNLLVNGNIH